VGGSVLKMKDRIEKNIEEPVCMNQKAQKGRVTLQGSNHPDIQEVKTLTATIQPIDKTT
jgi:hypothetical protein